MKMQWTFIFALVFALVIAVFSVTNVEPVPVDYVFGTAQFPLIMVILGSALAGGLAVGLFGTFRTVKMYRQIRALQRELQAAKDEAAKAQQPAALSSGEAAETAAPQPTAPEGAASPAGTGSPGSGQ
ncbi:LapA family protein [Paenibacillus alkalitolerans]|uniref:LapA family protein n=1 Tax=Paenibacillus alkalitolerans TaxID=2799335 RepID=UPI0018F7B6F7|nr:lipopolysaccharide assembly protein LapA domain-containing protein [Paenibacillus alkalitolerans]